MAPGKLGGSCQSIAPLASYPVLRYGMNRSRREGLKVPEKVSPPTQEELKITFRTLETIFNQNTTDPFAKQTITVLVQMLKNKFGVK